MPEVFIWWGDSDTGKTRGAYDLAGKEKLDIWSYMGGGWFDGYCGQDIALFDEFDGDDLTFSMWKKVCDRYPLVVPIKGGSVNFNPKVIIFTSNQDPKSWFSKSRVGVDWWHQITRRCKEIKEFKRIL